MFAKATIIAPGLLGASLAMAMRERSLADRICVWARRQAVVDALKGKAWCDEASLDLAQTCQGSDLIILCAPVERIIELAGAIAPTLDSHPIVTDVGSVKSEIVRKCTAALKNKAHFVGSHPMAGSEKTGMENGASDLFEGRISFVTPYQETDEQAVKRIVSLWEHLGSKTLVESPEDHDAIVAKTSHLPHILAAALSHYLDRACPKADESCGNGLRDTTRIAAGDPTLWQEIIFQNRDEIMRSLSDFQEDLQEFYAAIANNDELAVAQKLIRGKAFRDRL